MSFVIDLLAVSGSCRQRGDDGADDLRDDVGRRVAPRELTHHGQADRDGRVDGHPTDLPQRHIECLPVIPPTQILSMVVI